MADPFSINRQTQIAVETTPGTAVPANKLLTSLTMAVDPTFTVTKIKGTGRRFTSIVAPDGQESSGGALGGGVTYTEIVYPFSMTWGAAVITTPAGAVNARQWKWTVPLSGRVNPKAMTIEQGDSDDSERATYAVITDLSVDMSRAATAISGTMLARAIEKANLGTSLFTGMTASPTAIGLVPVLPSKWDAYLDTVYTAFGTTHLGRCFKGNLAYSGAFLPYFPMDSSLTSFAGVADSDGVGTAASMTLVKDAVGEGLWTTARGGKTLYLRFLAKGDLIDNIATISITGSPTGGTFTITYKGQTTAPITYSAALTAATVNTAFQLLSTVGTNAVVTGSTGGPYIITFSGTLASDTSLVTTTNSFTGGASPNTVITVTQVPYSFQIDMAVKIAKPNATDSTQGLRTRQWDLEVVEDAAWGNGLVVTVVNTQTGL